MPIGDVRAQRSPLVTIADADFDRLDALALAGQFAGHPVADFLAAELERALVCLADEIGPNVVRMNSRVAFRIGVRRDITVRRLVYPEEYARRGNRTGCLSVMTPLGVALLGLRVGAGGSYETENGTAQYVTVAAVLHQPDAVERECSGGDRRERPATPACRNRNHWNDDDPGPAA